MSEFWQGYLRTIIFVFIVAVVLGGIFLAVSLIAGSPGG